MIQLLQSFAAGLCFAFGAFVGIGLAGLYARRKEVSKLADILAVNRGIEARMTRQVGAIERIAESLIIPPIHTATDAGKEAAK